MDGNDPKCAWHRGTMTTALSRLSKNIAKGTEKAVLLSGGYLSLLDDYFTIQKYRYGGTISLEYRIDDEAALSCLIPRFTLQPVVENSIFHGIEPKGTPGTITIHIFRKNDAILQIDITDDGVGMTEEQARQLLSENRNEIDSTFSGKSASATCTSGCSMNSAKITACVWKAGFPNLPLCPSCFRFVRRRKTSAKCRQIFLPRTKKWGYSYGTASYRG